MSVGTVATTPQPEWMILPNGPAKADDRGDQEYRAHGERKCVSCGGLAVHEPRYVESEHFEGTRQMQERERVGLRCSGRSPASVNAPSLR